MAKLASDFYLQTNVLILAKALLGKILVTKIDGEITSGRIVETEAYNGVVDKASHAYNGRRTKRTATMYKKGGVAYVYLCYGLHQMLNVVVGPQDMPLAILIRAVEPITGIDSMLKRTGKAQLDFSLTRGPGNVAKAFGITSQQNNEDLNADVVFIADDGQIIADKQIRMTPRIGVNYAGEDAALLYRFLVDGNRYVSGKK